MVIPPNKTKIALDNLKDERLHTPWYHLGSPPPHGNSLIEFHQTPAL